MILLVVTREAVNSSVRQPLYLATTESYQTFETGENLLNMVCAWKYIFSTTLDEKKHERLIFK